MTRAGPPEGPASSAVLSFSFADRAASDAQHAGETRCCCSLREKLKSKTLLLTSRRGGLGLDEAPRAALRNSAAAALVDANLLVCGEVRPYALIVYCVVSTGKGFAVCMGAVLVDEA
jgi:hypothetical protein